MIGKEVDETVVRALANPARPDRIASPDDHFTLEERLEAHRLVVEQHRRARSPGGTSPEETDPDDGGTP